MRKQTRRDELNINRKKLPRHIFAQKCFWICRVSIKTTYRLSYKSTLTRKKDHAALQETVALADARSEIEHIQWYVPHFILSSPQQGILSKQLFSKTTTEVRYIERSVCIKM